MPVLSVNRNCISWFHQRINQLDFLPAGVSGHMSVLENHLRPFAEQFIDDVGHSLFISRYGIGAEYNGISRLNGDFLMKACCHTGQCRHRLSLTSGSNQHRLFIGIILQLLNIYQCMLRYLQIPKLRSCSNDIYHTAAFHHNLTPEFISRIDNLLYTVHIGSKRGNDDSGIGVIRKNIVKGLSHRAFRIGKARPFRIGAVTHQRQHALLADFAKPLQVNGIAEYRRVVHLKVSRMHHNSCRRIDGQGRSVLNTVIGPDKFHPETAQIDMLSVFYHLTLYFGKHIMLPQLIIYNTDGQLCCINGHVNIPQNIRNGPDMVFMAMGNKKSFYFLDIILQIGNIRNYQVNTQHIIFRKRQTAVHHNNTVFVFKGSNVHSNLLQSA